MEYFITGASGFIGKRLVRKLLARRGAVVHFLIRQSSQDKVAELLDYWGVDGKRARWVDLEGEGLPGVLVQHGEGLF